MQGYRFSHPVVSPVSTLVQKSDEHSVFPFLFGSSLHMIYNIIVYKYEFRIAKGSACQEPTYKKNNKSVFTAVSYSILNIKAK